MNEELLQKYLENDVSPQERELIIGWIKSDSENQKKFNILKAEHVSATMAHVSDTQDKMPYSAFKRKLRQKRYHKFVQYTGVAALVIAGLFLYSDRISLPDRIHGLDSHLLTIRSESTLNKKITLPDGSKVQLNIESSLEYPKSFTDGERRVTLVGEGLFEIVHDPLRPFIVTTADYDVKVLGTTFNVKFYDNDTRTETTLIEGGVELLREAQAPVVLFPSQKAIFSKREKRMKIEKVNSLEAIAWKKGSIVFNRTPLQQVALDLERKYDVEITISSPDLLRYEYTGTFDNLDLEESLRLLMVSSSIDYEMKKNKITLKMKE